MRKRLRRALVRQFGSPRGLVGRVVGWSMAVRSSNVARSRWAVDMLDLQPGERLLEVGCGPGVALAAAVARGAIAVGVDRSPVMAAQARRRAHVAVVVGSADALPQFDAPFDKALAVNTVGHWDDQHAGLTGIAAALRPGGTIAVVSQPRCPGATAADTNRAGADLERLLTGAGFVDLRTETLALDPPAVCVLGRRPTIRGRSDVDS